MARTMLLPGAGRVPLLGNAEIDSDHLAITEQLRKTIGCEAIQFPFFIAQLKKLLHRHFDHEAELMERAGGQLCSCHRGEHQALLDLCDQAQHLGHRSLRKAQILLRGRFPKLVRKHVLFMDQIAVLFINTSGEAAPCRTCP